MKEVATIMSGNKQKQSGGDNSTNIQAGNVIINGISYSEVRQIAQDVFESNFLKLKGDAFDIARTRANQFIEDYLKELQEKHPEGLAKSIDPDMQYAIFEAQREFARSGDEELSKLLINLLIERTKENDKSLKQIVLNESLTVVPKLTLEHLNILSIVFLLKEAKFNNLNGLEQFNADIKQFLFPLLDNINLNNKSSFYQHLVFSRCASISIGAITIPQLMLARYPGLFCKGFKLEQFQAIAGDNSINYQKHLLIPSLQNSALMQIRALDNEVLYKNCRELNVEEPVIEKIKNLQNTHLLNEDEVKKYLISIGTSAEQLLQIWSKSPLQNMTLTSVGIAIAHANIIKKMGLAEIERVFI